MTDVFDISKEDLQRTFTQIEFHNKSDQSMLENCDVEIHNLLKKTISYQKRTYTSHSLLKSKIVQMNQGLNAELENEEKMGIDLNLKKMDQNKENCCQIF